LLARDVPDLGIQLFNQALEVGFRHEQSPKLRRNPVFVKLCSDILKLLEASSIP